MSRRDTVRVAITHGCEVAAMKQLFLSFFGVLALASCTSQSESREPSSATGDLHSYSLTAGLDCAPSLGLLQCLRQNERSAAQRHGVDLTRSGSEACLSSKTTVKVCLRDESGVSYAFFERVQGTFVVVEAEDTGGYAVLIVSEKTGQQRRVDNRPLFSADGSLFATVSYDTDAGYVPNRVAIWDSTGTAPLYKVDRFAPGTGPTAIRWISPEKLEVHYSRSEYSPDRDENTGNFSIWRDDESAWRDNYTG